MSCLKSYGDGCSRGNLSASDPGQAVATEHRLGVLVHVRTFVNLFVIPCVVPKGLKQVKGGGRGKGIEGGYSSTFSTGIRKINCTFFKLFFLEAPLLRMNYI